MSYSVSDQKAAAGAFAGTCRRYDLPPSKRLPSLSLNDLDVISTGAGLHDAEGGRRVDRAVGVVQPLVDLAVGVGLLDRIHLEHPVPVRAGKRLGVAGNGRRHGTACTRPIASPIRAASSRIARCRASGLNGLPFSMPSGLSMPM